MAGYGDNGFSRMSPEEWRGFVGATLQSLKDDYAEMNERVKKMCEQQGIHDTRIHDVEQAIEVNRSAANGKNKIFITVLQFVVPALIAAGAVAIARK